MSLTDPVSAQSSGTLRAILWVVASAIIFSLLYKVAVRKQVEHKANCLDSASSAQRTMSPVAAVEKYAACIGPSTAGAGRTANDKRPARCRYVGVWAAARGNVIYNVTLGADGRFVAEPGDNAPPGAASITGAWSVAGPALAWVYDSGPVWPPDVNPISAESTAGFTLSEVNGSTTRYTLIERHAPAICAK